MLSCVILLFDKFETLDAFGPAEVLGSFPRSMSLSYCSVQGGTVESSQGARIETIPLAGLPLQVLLVPGGQGSRRLVNDPAFLSALRQTARDAQYLLSVCTGAALLARAGLLTGKKATTNKQAFDWVAGQGPDVCWQRSARWVQDGGLFTSSGVSAGMDMTLAFAAHLFGPAAAWAAARRMEYLWNSNSTHDPFSLPM